MAIERTRKNKENPHYGFLVSWQPKEPSGTHVKGESRSDKISSPATVRHEKKAEYLAQDGSASKTRKNILRSLILISFILFLELVIYLAWSKFMIK
ncbi:MAG: hypothetical protein ABSC49_01455 [Candidatus Microgenomates bacterium]